MEDMKAHVFPHSNSKKLISNNGDLHAARAVTRRYRCILPIKIDFLK